MEAEVGHTAQGTRHPLELIPHEQPWIRTIACPHCAATWRISRSNWDRFTAYVCERYSEDRVALDIGRVPQDDIDWISQPVSEADMARACEAAITVVEMP